MNCNSKNNQLKERDYIHNKIIKKEVVTVTTYILSLLNILRMLKNIEEAQRCKILRKDSNGNSEEKHNIWKEKHTGRDYQLVKCCRNINRELDNRKPETVQKQRETKGLKIIKK